MSGSSLSTIAVGIWVAFLCGAMGYLCFLAGRLYRSRSVRLDWVPLCTVLLQGVAAAAACVALLLIQQKAGAGQEALVVTLILGATWAVALFPVALGPRRS